MGSPKGWVFQLGSPPLPRLGVRVRSRGRPWWGVGVVVERREKRAIRWPGGNFTMRLDPRTLKELDLCPAEDEDDEQR